MQVGARAAALQPSALLKEPGRALAQAVLTSWRMAMGRRRPPADTRPCGQEGPRAGSAHGSKESLLGSTSSQAPRLAQQALMHKALAGAKVYCGGWGWRGRALFR